MTTFRVSLEQPRHGWVPVRVELGEEVFEFVGSYTPNNPIQDLADGLAESAIGLDAEVLWHLEPDGYYFRFSPSGSRVRFRLLFARDSRRSEASEVASVEADRGTILLPVWRALRRFQSYSVEAAHWPAVNFAPIMGLKSTLR